MRWLALMPVSFVVMMLLGGCGGRPIIYSREAPAGVYPAGLLSGASFGMVGWRIPF